MNLKDSFKELNEKLKQKHHKLTLEPFKIKEEIERATYYEISGLLNVYGSAMNKHKKKIENFRQHISRLLKLHEIYDEKFTQSFGNPEYKNIDIDKEHITIRPVIKQSIIYSYHSYLLYEC